MRGERVIVISNQTGFAFACVHPDRHAGPLAGVLCQDCQPEKLTPRQHAAAVERERLAAEWGRILSRDGLITGWPTGHTRRCGQDGCRGRKLEIKWQDGSRTFVCTRGLSPVAGKEANTYTWQIS